MTLAQLRYAITVANSNSMNEAARTLFISQPSLSSAILELEEEIGVELFRRTNRGISVTPEGEEFLGYARQVVEQYALIESKYISKEQTKKKFSVSCSIIPSRSMPSWKWSSSSEWMSMSSRSTKPGPMTLLPI